MTKFAQKSFMVPVGDSEEYRREHVRIFGEKLKCPKCGSHDKPLEKLTALLCERCHFILRSL